MNSTADIVPDMLAAIVTVHPDLRRRDRALEPARRSWSRAWRMVEQ
jgi:hypothetical protein